MADARRETSGEIMRAHGFDGDPDKFEAWLSQRTRDNMERLGLSTLEEYDLYLRGRVDGYNEAETERRREIRVAGIAFEGGRWIATALVVCACIVIALGVLWAFFALMQVTEPWGWSSLLIVPVGAVLFLVRDQRRRS